MTAANVLRRWLVQEPVEIAVPSEVSLGRRLTSSVPWIREPRRDVPMILSPSGTRLRRNVWHTVEEEAGRECVNQTVLSLQFGWPARHRGHAVNVLSPPGFVASVVRRMEHELPTVPDFRHWRHPCGQPMPGTPHLCSLRWILGPAHRAQKKPSHAKGWNHALSGRSLGQQRCATETKQGCEPKCFGWIGHK
jgi:hypothetical protein